MILSLRKPNGYQTVLILNGRSHDDAETLALFNADFDRPYFAAGSAAFLEKLAPRF